MAFLVVARGGPGPDGDRAAEPPAGSRRSSRALRACPSREATDASPIARDRVYVLPSDALARVDRGVLHLGVPAPGRPQMPVDALLRALAIERDGGAIAVVLGGSGSDGALGVQAIKARGGIVFAADPRSAGLPAMPAAAIGTGCVDHVAAPEGIAAELCGIADRMRAALQSPLPPPPPGSSFPPPPPVGLEGDPDVKRILTVVQAAHQVDFSFYRQSTVTRRIQRRMVLDRVRHRRAPTSTCSGSARPRSPRSAATCSSTSPSSSATRRSSTPSTASSSRSSSRAAGRPSWRAPGSALRRARPSASGSPGRATGEEVYSLAIALIEAAEERRVDRALPDFGTDVSDEGAGGGARRRLPREHRGPTSRPSGSCVSSRGRARAGRLAGRIPLRRCLPLRAARHHPRHALLPPRYRELPQRAHLPRSGRAAAHPPPPPLRARARAAPSSSARRRPPAGRDGFLPPPRQERQDLRQGRGARPGRALRAPVRPPPPPRPRPRRRRTVPRITPAPRAGGRSGRRTGW